MVPKTLAAAIRKWPSTDLAELLALIHSEIHARAEHHAKGGGVEAELAKRSKSRRVDRRPAK